MATYCKSVDSLFRYNYLLKREYVCFASEIESLKEILPEGLTLERETYLYREIRGLVNDSQAPRILHRWSSDRVVD